MKIQTLCVLIALGAAANQPALAGQGRSPADHEGRPQIQHHGKHSSKRLKKMDQNNDHRISRDEWHGKDNSFDRLDSNQDGFLTGDEFRSASKDFKGKHSRARGLRKMDENGDGNISRDEWKANEDTFNRLL